CLHHGLDSEVVISAKEFGYECGPHLQAIGHLRFADAECLHALKEFFCELQDRCFDPEAVALFRAIEGVLNWLLAVHRLRISYRYWTGLFGGEIPVSRFSGLCNFPVLGFLGSFAKSMA